LKSGLLLRASLHFVAGSYMIGFMPKGLRIFKASRCFLRLGVHPFKRRGCRWGVCKSKSDG
jgi:hypothetical protein